MLIIVRIQNNIMRPRRYSHDTTSDAEFVTYGTESIAEAGVHRLDGSYPDALRRTLFHRRDGMGMMKRFKCQMRSHGGYLLGAWRAGGEFGVGMRAPPFARPAPAVLAR